jgi:hypothetical protein
VREPSDALQTPRRTGPHRTVKVHPRTPKGVVRVAAREQVTEAQARLQLRLWEHPRAVLQQGCLQACDGAEDTLLRVDRDLHTATSPTAARAEREREGERGGTALTTCSASAHSACGISLRLTSPVRCRLLALGITHARPSCFRAHSCVDSLPRAYSTAPSVL